MCLSEIKTSPGDCIFRILMHAWLASLIFSTFLAEALALVLGAMWLARRPSTSAMGTGLSRLVLMFFALRLLTIATALSPAVSAAALRKIPFLLVYFPLFAFVRAHKPVETIKLLRTLTCAAVGASIYGLVKILVTGLQRVHSTTSGPTTLAIFLAAGFVVALALQIEALLNPKRFWLPGLIFMLAAMAFTYCRAPWVAACSVAMGMLLRRARGKVLLLLGVVIFILAVVPNFRMRYVEVLQWPHAMGDRPVIWQKGWELVQARPLLGYGPESFHLLFDQQHRLKDRRVGAWHNFILQLWVESGFVAVLVFAGILFQALRAGAVHVEISKCAESAAATRALLAGVIVLLLAGLFGGLIGDPIIDMLFWGMLGMLAALSAGEKAAEKTSTLKTT